MNQSPSLDNDSQPTKIDFESCFHDEPPLRSDDLAEVRTQVRSHRQRTAGAVAVAAAVLAGAVWIGISPGQPPTLTPAGKPSPGLPSKAPGLPSEGPGEPSEAPGEPSEGPGDPSEAPGEPSEGPGDPSEAPGEPSEAPGDPSEAPGEPSEEPGLPSPR